MRWGNPGVQRAMGRCYAKGGAPLPLRQVVLLISKRKRYEGRGKVYRAERVFPGITKDIGVCEVDVLETRKECRHGALS